MHIQTEVPGAGFKEVSAVFCLICLIRQYTFHISLLRGLFLIYKDPPPGKNAPCWRLLMPQMH